MLPGLLYGCETWSLSLKEEHKFTSVWRQRGLENIWTCERWNEQFRLHIMKNFCDLCRSPIVIIIIISTCNLPGHVTRMAETGNVCGILGETSWKISTWMTLKEFGRWY
jgi:hypothetical protein